MNKRTLLITLLFTVPATFANAQSEQPKDPESIITAPLDIDAEAKVRSSYFGSRHYQDQGGYQVGSANMEYSLIEAFNFDNKGPNTIIPTEPNIMGGSPYRAFSFNFSNRAKQDIHVTITDSPTDKLSHRMESYILFFPRKILPAIEWPSDTSQPYFTVTLPTLETVLFSKKTKEIVSGALKELAPIDLGPDRFKRKFAQIEYSGQGLMLRVDKRGQDPRFNNTATLTYRGKSCKMTSSLLFNQDESSTAAFKFKTDEAFNELVKKTCKFSFL